eukprot:515466_1
MITSSEFHKIFEENTQECNLRQTDNEIDKMNIISQCAYALRISKALKYYQLLLSQTLSSSSTQIFLAFINNSYSMFIDDYIHLISEHSNDIMAINKDLQTNHGFKCDISNCQITRRRYENRNEGVNNNNTLDHNMHCELFDNIHFYLIHLEDSGLRMNLLLSTNKGVTDNDNANDSKEDDYLNFIDNQFKQQCQKMKLKRKQWGLLGFDRLNNEKNTKFNIMANQQHAHSDQHNKNGGVTFIDNMITKIIKNGDVDTINIKKVSEYIENEEYDSDALIEDINDINDGKQGNIYLNVLNHSDDKCFAVICVLIKNYTITAVEFNTGIVFWYWDWYKTEKNVKQFEEASQLTYYNQNDFGGHSVADLFIDCHYQSMKEEILNCSFISIHQYDEFVIKKGDMYYAADKVKKIRCKQWRDPLHFGIRKKARLHIEHLYALILYCDFTLFCSEFSSTFRGIKWNETLQEIKNRHKKYVNIAKKLREIIQYYGISGCYSSDGEYERGPFYCGMSIILNIAEFAIRLNGPTSTSKEVVIAERFAGRKGCILQLDNRIDGPDHERFFNCSWISCFPEEEERLWMAGQHKLELESIIIVDTAKNYQKFFKVFMKFDMMISGSKFTKNITRKDVRILSACIKQPKQLEQYINDTLYLFRSKKRQLILNLYQINEIIAKKNKRGAEFVKLMNINLTPSNTSSECDLFASSPIILTLFPNIDEMIIYAAYNDYYGNYYWFLLSLTSFKSMFSSYKSLQRIVIKCEQKYNKNKWYSVSWLQNAFSSTNKVQLNIELKTTEKNSRGYKEDWLIVMP